MWRTVRLAMKSINKSLSRSTGRCLWTAIMVGVGWWSGAFFDVWQMAASDVIQVDTRQP